MMIILFFISCLCISGLSKMFHKWNTFLSACTKQRGKQSKAKLDSLLAYDRNTWPLGPHLAAGALRARSFWSCYQEGTRKVGTEQDENDVQIERLGEE